MPRYAIAFHSELKGNSQKLLEASSEEEALKIYFDHFCEDYSKDAEGFACFKEDFLDESSPLGSLIEV